MKAKTLRKKTIVDFLRKATIEESWMTDLLVSSASASNIGGLTNLYRNAFERGDWFGSGLPVAVPSDVTSEILWKHFNRAGATCVVFENERGDVVGATGLYVDSNNEILIDDTQIDPDLGRRRGIMSRYFRYLVPLLRVKGFSFWTEFVLTPESKILRSVLVSELNMQVTGLRPNCFSHPYKRSTSSALVAHGDLGAATRFLSELTMSDCTALQAFACACLGRSKSDAPETIARRESTEYRQMTVLNNDLSKVGKIVASGWHPVAAIPCKKAVTVARWPALSSEFRTRFEAENIASLNQLIGLLNE